MRGINYLKIRAFELNGHFYEKLGVRYFKKFASSGDLVTKKLRKTDPNFKIVTNYQSALDWEARTNFNEIVHLLNLIFNIIMLIWLYTKGRYMWIIPIILLNLLLNVYPIILQRYNRARIQRIRMLKQNLKATL